MSRLLMSRMLSEGHRRELNPQPELYKSPALPIELRWRWWRTQDFHLDFRVHHPVS